MTDMQNTLQIYNNIQLLTFIKRPEGINEKKLHLTWNTLVFIRVLPRVIYSHTLLWLYTCKCISTFFVASLNTFLTIIFHIRRQNNTVLQAWQPPFLLAQEKSPGHRCSPCKPWWSRASSTGQWSDWRLCESWREIRFECSCNKFM